jgi:hypothetical protein
MEPNGAPATSGVRGVFPRHKEVLATSELVDDDDLKMSEYTVVNVNNQSVVGK